MTITERGYKYFGGNTTLQNFCREAYINGCKDQHKIDIENFKKLLKLQVLYKALTEESMEVIIENLNSMQNGDL